MKENEDCIVLVPHISGQKDKDMIFQGCGDMTIPTVAIVKTQVLRDA